MVLGETPFDFVTSPLNDLEATQEKGVRLRTVRETRFPKR
jgi:hypothetical protein